MENNERKAQNYLNNLESQAKAKTERLRHSSSGPCMDAVDKVLPAVLNRLGLDRRLKEHAIMQMWETLVSGAIAERSRPLFIDSQHNLVIAVADAAVAQELSLMKAKVLKTLSVTARSLGIELKALRIDMKHFHRSPEPATPEDVQFPQPCDRELCDLTLNTHDMQLIGELSKRLAEQNESPPVRKGVLGAYERQLRLAEWRRRHGYPACQQCGSPVQRLYEHGAHKVCFNCKVADQE